MRPPSASKAFHSLPDAMPSSPRSSRPADKSAPASAISRICDGDRSAAQALKPAPKSLADGICFEGVHGITCRHADDRGAAAEDVSTLVSKLGKCTRSNDLQLVVGPSKTRLRKAERPNGLDPCAARHAQWICWLCSPLVASAARKLCFVGVSLGVLRCRSRR